ncbi:hypothetical protein [Konateibacter massiliensis]|uniref:hypothetical protein n=1 Tax=Konateibacter massiliensis TaxID=2002841 RepID=UPI00117AA8BF|nr:hypothetical protein [Konateibacter massiliensis]
MKKLSTPNGRWTSETGRVSSFTSQRASLTVETALVLPLFLFAICFFMYFTEVIRTEAEIGNELYKQGKDLALYAYVYSRAESNSLIASGQLKDVAAGALSSVYVGSQVKQELGEYYYEHNHIESGINLLLSSFMKEDDMVDIVALYKIEIPCNFFNLSQVRVMQRARIRGWTGYESAKGEGEDAEEEIVYITKTGTVYHRDRLCTHIKLSISTVSKGEIALLRNSSGGKYHECEICGERPDTDFYYITDTGDRYHKVRDCSGIRRDVTAIPISEAGDRTPCSRCGY